METIFKCIVGSQVYGTNTPESDIDYKGIFIEPIENVIGFKRYKQQINVSKDETYYEIGRFLELAQISNPTIIEMFYIPDDKIIQKSPIYDFLKNNRELFLSKELISSFIGYASSQIYKSNGLQKKMNWEKSKTERKTVLDFCYINYGNKNIPLKTFLETKNYKQDLFGLSKLQHSDGAYMAYYDKNKQYKVKGIVKSENSNEVSLSNIPLEHDMESYLLFFNSNAYTQHCKDYKSYQTWLAERNTARYVDINEHKQSYDGKNLLHCVRLIDMGIEIIETKNITFPRPNADYLLDIRKGKVDLKEIVEYSEKRIKELTEMKNDSNLPKMVSNDVIHDILLKIRFNQL